MKQITVNSQKYRIEITFPYTIGLVQQVKSLPDRVWDAENKIWYLPLTQFHARVAASFGREHGFALSKSVLDLSRASDRLRNDGIRSKLYPFQIEALDFLHKSGGRCLLADEMGLGKTITTLAWIGESQFSSVLIVAPASVIYNWEREINRWLPGWSVQIVNNGKTEIGTARIIVMSYNIMVKQLSVLQEKIFDAVVFDECHYLSNYKSQRSRAASQLHTVHFLGLSGTPFLNRPIELWPLLNMIAPSQWKSRFWYGVRYCGGHQDYFGWRFDGATNLDELRNKIKNIFIRRTKLEVLKDLPPMTRTIMPILPSDLTEYFHTLSEIRAQLPAAKHADKLNMLARLRQIIGYLKVPAAVELAEDVLSSKQKVVLFAHHKTVVQALENGLQKYGVCKIVGDTDKSERQRIVDAFASSSSPYRVMIISLAGGEGINLQSADTLIFVEREWNPGKESQIEGRLHRIGQSNPVQIIYLIAKGTIDAHISRIIEQKREVIGKVITLDDIPLEEILEIDYANSSS